MVSPTVAPITLPEFLDRLNEGKHVFPGGYALFLVMADGCALTFEAAEAEKDMIIQALKDRAEGYPNDGWLPYGFDVNWEDDDLYCDHTGVKIEPEYTDD